MGMGMGMDLCDCGKGISLKTSRLLSKTLCSILPKLCDKYLNKMQSCQRTKDEGRRTTEDGRRAKDEERKTQNDDDFPPTMTAMTMTTADENRVRCSRFPQQITIFAANCCRVKKFKHSAGARREGVAWQARLFNNN